MFFSRRRHRLSIPPGRAAVAPELPQWAAMWRSRAPPATRALIFDTPGADVPSVDLGPLDDAVSSTSIAPLRLEPRPAPGWLTVRGAASDEPFELAVHAVVPAADPAFAHERWMDQLGAAIAGLPLNQLCLVGSHDAATGGINPRSAWASDWQNPALNPRTGVRASRAAETSIGQQLLAGVRYLDLRVDLDDDGEPWMVHGLRGERLDAVAADLAAFFEGHPRELVVVDLQHITGADPDRHRLVMERLAPALAGRLVDPVAITPTSTVGEVWARGEQAVLLMSDAPDALHADYPLWRRADRLESLWGTLCTGSGGGRPRPEPAPRRPRALSAARSMRACRRPSGP